MRRTLQEQIRANRNGSIAFVVGLLVLLVALGTAIVGAYAPDQWYYGTAGAAALGLIAALVAAKSGPGIVLAMSGTRAATPIEEQTLRNVTEEMAIAAGLPMPKVVVIDDDTPNAFATGTSPENGTIAVTTGLMRKLNRDELQGVVAHEISHIRNYDIRFMTTVAIIAGLIPMIADVFLRSMWFGGPRRRSRDNDSGGDQLQTVFMIVGLLLAILAPLFAKLLELAVSRKREFLADASAAELTRYPEGLANALEKISRDPGQLHTANRATQHMYIVNPLRLSGSTSSMFSTHPSTEDRVRALMGIAGVKVPPRLE